MADLKSEIAIRDSKQRGLGHGDLDLLGPMNAKDLIVELGRFLQRGAD